MKNSSRHSTLLSAQSSLRVLGASKRQAFLSPAFLSYGPFVLGPFCPQAFLSVYPGGAGRPKFNQLEMVTTFKLTYKPSLVRIDACNFELSW